MKNWSNLQKGGQIGPLEPNFSAVVQEIIRALNMLGIRFLAGSPTGIGQHKWNRAVDFQGGIGNNPVHQAIVDYCLKNWKRFDLYYMAFGGYEYLPANNAQGYYRRVQPRYEWEPRVSDPRHRNHVHIDRRNNSKTGANPNIRVGAAFDNIRDGHLLEVQKMLAELGIYEHAHDGIDGPYTQNAVRTYQKETGLAQTGVADTSTRQHLEADMKKIDEILAAVERQRDDSDKIKKAIDVLKANDAQTDQRLNTYSDYLDAIWEQVYMEDSKRTLRERVEQNNAATNRIEKHVGTYGLEKGDV